ncbi:MAG: DUF4153 domain-containing protein, partial [Prolixibacteraceae bacterium]
KGFEQAFSNIYTDISASKIAEFWKARLEYDHPLEDKFTFDRKDVLFLVITCLISGILIKIPQIFDINLKEFLFYEKNAALIVFLGLSIYAFLNKESISKKALMYSAGAFLIAAIYINLLPSVEESNSMILAYLHLPLFFWCVYGLIYTDYDTKDKMKRIDYIKYNGDLAILSGLILIAGGILTAVTTGLFKAIDLNIDQFYVQYIAVSGLVSAPVVATYVIRNYPSVTNKIAPIIATIFSPLVLITLFIYLISIPFAGKDPYNDRNFLMIFNLMLLGVMGIITFSISETSIHKKQKFNELIVFGIVVLTLIIDLVALSAIVYRVGEYGFTPNRTAVLGSNILIFCNLVLIMRDLYRVNFQNRDIRQVELTIAGYLPIYAAWTILVVFGFPLVFGLK